MPTAVVVGTPLADALSNVIQPKLVEMGWSSEGGDDSALTDYVILMLVNGKTQEQIAGELSNDLLGLREGDTQALDFSQWLFAQVEVLNRQINGDSGAAAAGQDGSGGVHEGGPDLSEANGNGDVSTEQDQQQQPLAIPSIGDQEPDDQGIDGGVGGQDGNEEFV